MVLNHERVRKPFAASMLANVAYLLLGIATCDAVGAPWQWADSALGALGVPVPSPNSSAPNAADAVVAAARGTSSVLLQALLMMPLFLLVTVASTVWWGDVATRGAAAASASGTRGPSPAPAPPPVPDPAAAPSSAGASAFAGIAASALRVAALVLVQAEAAVLDAIGRAVGAPALTRLPMLVSACSASAAPVAAADAASDSVVCLVAGTLFSGQLWGWVLGMALRLVAAASLGAVYAHMATDPARAVAAAVSNPAGSPGPMARMLAADAELPWLLGAGLPLTAASALAGEWGGFHVGTAAYGVGSSLLAVMAAASPWAASGGAGVAPSAGAAPSGGLSLFSANAAAAAWLVTWVLGPG